MRTIVLEKRKSRNINVVVAIQNDDGKIYSDSRDYVFDYGKNSFVQFGNLITEATDFETVEKFADFLVKERGYKLQENEPKKEVSKKKKSKSR